VKKRSGSVRREPDPAPAIRSRYEEHGVEAYYRDHAADYRNPHFPEIRALLRENVARLDTGHVLDFAAGSGEVTLVLQELGVSALTGCDPYTFEAYAARTGRPCLRHSFRDVIKNGLPGSYSLVVCSFALHLCPEKDLFPLAWNLLEAAPTLLVLTPHKRPELELRPGISLGWEDFTCTGRGKKVRLKAYIRK
jgi:SAM-dependent methyltransferase